ncbi:MAG: DUF3336 domain-containing protein [Gammaproteobacteria bacterium]
MSSVNKSKLLLEMRDAPSYSAWVKLAKAHDLATGKEKWRKKVKSPLYDYSAIERRLEELRTLRKARDQRGLLYTLNQGIHGNIGGMGSSKLYRQSKFGTKELIIDYIDEVVTALQHLAKSRSRTIGFEERLEFFRRASHCFGQSGLMLSGGAALSHFHVGVAKALNDESILPSVISGSSGGSLVAAVLGTHSDDELDYFFEPANLVMEAKNEASWMQNLIPFVAPRLDVSDLENVLERMLPDVTFAEAYEISGRWINVSVAPYEQHQTSRLLNAITSPNVYVRKAVMASCAIPGVFPAVTLEAKSVTTGKRRPYLPRRKWIDGSMSQDMPMKRLSRLYGTNHYIASQVNPHVLWFLQDPKGRQNLWTTGMNAALRSYQEWLRATQPLTHKMVRSFPPVEYLYRSFYSVATQQYTGDITITPRSPYFNPMRLLARLTEKELMNLITEGQQATYPKIEMIRNCTKISRALQDIIADYEGRALRKSGKGKGPKLVVAS